MWYYRWAKLREPEGDTAGPILRERLGDAFNNIRYTQMSLSEFSNGPVVVIKLIIRLICVKTLTLNEIDLTSIEQINMSSFELNLCD